MPDFYELMSEYSDAASGPGANAGTRFWPPAPAQEGASSSFLVAPIPFSTSYFEDPGPTVIYSLVESGGHRRYQLSNAH